MNESTKIATIIVLCLFLCWSVVDFSHNQAPAYQWPPVIVKPYHPIHEEPASSIKLSFIGDIMAHNVNYNRPPYSNIYKGISHQFSGRDFVFGNLEFNVNPERPYSTYPVFNVKPPYVEAAIEAGVNVFSLANNHIADLGLASLRKTDETLKMMSTKHPIYLNGLKSDPEGSYDITMIPYEDWRIGFLAVTQFSNSPYHGGYIQFARFNPYTKRGGDNKRFERAQQSEDKFIDYIAAVAPDYDLFILSFHGDSEYQRQPSAPKARFFRRLISAGVDVVWGHHPHVLQPWEAVEHQGELKLIYYSTGNFISGQFWNTNPAKLNYDRSFTGDTAVFHAGFEKRGRRIILNQAEIALAGTYQESREVGLVVRSYDDLSTDPTLPEEWQTYYQKRYSELKILMSDYSDLFSLFEK